MPKTPPLPQKKTAEMSENITLEKAAELIAAAPSLLFLCHARPDGDTLGSASGLKAFLAANFPEKEVHILCEDGVTPYLSFIDGIETALPDGFEPSKIVALDAAALHLLGKFGGEYENRIDLKLDHHVRSDSYADFNFVNSKAAACGEIVCSLLKLIGGTIPVTALNMLYAAIASDCGCFRYENTTPATLRIAAELIEAGAESSKINHLLFESRSPATVRAINAAYTHLRYFDGGKTTLVLFSNEIKEQYGITDDDIGEVSSLTREILGVTLGITVKQNSTDPEKFKISMRSSEPVDVCALCARFGGGGHIRAAGAEINASSPEEAVKKILLVCGIGE